LTALTPALLTSLVFGAALLLNVLVKLWLASRQIRAVARHRGAVPAEFARAIPLETHQRAADYTVARLRFGLLELMLGAAVLLGWTLLGGLDALNGALLDALGPRPLLQPLALLAAFALVNGLIELPASAWQTFVIEQRFGFNRMSARLWWADLFKSALLGVLIGLPLAAGVLWLMQATGSAWWLWTWGAWMAFSLLMLVLYPTLIAPLFNTFEPLDDAVLRERVAALMARCGFTAKGLFVMDGSRRSAHANAYFTGFGAAKRVVFFDTLLAQLPRPRWRPCWRTSWGTFGTGTSCSASSCCSRSASPAWHCWAGWPGRAGSTPAWASRPTCRPAWAGRCPTMRWRCCCSWAWCRCSCSSSRRWRPSSRAGTSSRPTPTPRTRPARRS